LFFKLSCFYNKEDQIKSPQKEHKMFEKTNNISELIVKYLHKEISVAEQAELDSWINASPVNRKVFDELSTDEKLLSDINVFRSADRNSLWLKTMDKVSNGQSSTESIPKKISIYHRYKYLAIAASLFFIIGLFYYIKTDHVIKISEVKVAKEIVPGKNSATLTLSDGKKIVLSEAMNGEIANESGVSISKSANGQLVYTLKDVKKSGKVNYNTLSTARGEQYQIILPDGTKVWLNAASSILYPENFLSLSERKVELVGEAYFEVAKNKHKPFYVKSKNQTVEVLGTHFNVNSYGDETAVKTTLLEGSVKINGTTILKPNEQAIVNGNNISVIPVIAESFVDWKEGVFAFKREDIYSVMRKISRWYDVEVVYQLTETNKQTYTGTISRSDNISKVLDVLQEIGSLKLKVEGKRIMVSN
jgi:transmembrane sensor